MAAAAAAASEPILIDVFTISDRPIARRAEPPGFIVRVHHIDALHRLEQELSHGLPTDEAQAKSMALRRVQAMGAAFNERTSQAMLGIELAYRYRIDRVPAIVFDQGSHVVYGVTDVDRAIALYSDKIRGRP